VVVWGALGAAAIVVFAFAYTQRPSPVAPEALPSIVYGGQTVVQPRSSYTLVCTAEALNTRLRAWVCTTWGALQPGQSFRPALDPGGACGVRRVDQTTARWICVRLTPPDPDSLPGGRPHSAPALSRAPV
jgi:hypothetical protein